MEIREATGNREAHEMRFSAMILDAVTSYLLDAEGFSDHNVGNVLANHLVHYLCERVGPETAADMFDGLAMFCRTGHVPGASKDAS